MLGPHLVDLKVWPFWRMYVPGGVGSGVSKAHATPPQLTFILSLSLLFPLPWTLFQLASLSYCSSEMLSPTVMFPSTTVMVQTTLYSPKLNVYKLLLSQCFVVATENQLSNPGWLLQSEQLGRTYITENRTLSEDLVRRGEQLRPGRQV